MMNAIAKPLYHMGMLPAMECSPNRYIKYAASLFAIHDINAMLRIGWPWWTLRSIDTIEAWLKTHDADIFEYGAGASTIWLAKRAQSVTSIDHDSHWYNMMTPFADAQQNITLQLEVPENISGDQETAYSSKRIKDADFQRYVTSIQRFNKKYDMIIIDGRARAACLDEAVQHLKKNGVIILDDSNRARYQEAIKSMGNAFTKESHRGLKVALPCVSETTIFYHNG